MSKAIDFYFDFSSPYGYFASTRIDDLAAEYGRKVNWHPVLLGAVFKTTGGMPLPMVPLKGVYSYRDFERSARFHGIPYQRPANFPLATQTAARAMLWVREQHGESKAVEFAKAVYRAYFVDGVNISDTDSIASIAASQGLDTAAVIDGANSAPVKEHLKADVDAAIARGVFGSPFVIVDDEPFWGFDRFDQLEAFLKNGTI
ncbi:MAG TPA: 2-hydroxychromene-2-carboxylate isomerase [Noviherbaspirillum sp.]|uniref:2-hydroxychromene-2-carboxylate isomerase n=1 Tax=Noviherbaspirillum sp. TaxID=1926288 RepID=UPI002B4919B8|nr:2-hydroxychromene-2-carboxylate isomerase [Noviherbaspirillum sp.]HJV01809.1 2-hydroxychromene-2-carboxylate isomerase [Burkholderiaceae bacterium]HJV83946.1 2-hydroxychromene-2-carboxylate isomerase [Noviherbaspirillum sp.]